MHCYSIRTRESVIIERTWTVAAKNTADALEDSDNWEQETWDIKEALTDREIIKVSQLGTELLEALREQGAAICPWCDRETTGGAIHHGRCTHCCEYDDCDRPACDHAENIARGIR